MSISKNKLESYVTHALETSDSVEMYSNQVFAEWYLDWGS